MFIKQKIQFSKNIGHNSKTNISRQIRLGYKSPWLLGYLTKMPNLTSDWPSDRRSEDARFD